MNAATNSQSESRVITMDNHNSNLFEMYTELGIINRKYCDKDEEKKYRKMLKNKQDLPDDSHVSNDGSFYRYVKEDMSKEEMNEYLFCKQVCYLKSIRFRLAILIAIAVISILLWFLSY